MFQVTQSPFLQALGYAIINSLWQYALLWLLYYFVSSVTRLSAHRLYQVALLSHLTGFVWFSGTLCYYYNFFVQTNGLPFFANIDSGFPGYSVSEKIYLLMVRAEVFLPYLSLAYMVLLTFMSVKTIRCYRKTHILRTREIEKAHIDWRLFTSRLAAQFGIKRKVSLFLSGLVESPVTVGFLKPMILLPISVVNNLSTEQVEAILLHELAHIKRHDYLINLLLSIIEITLFFNPFMQLLSKSIRRERENCCDDWVLQYQYSAASYARALLKIAVNKVASNGSLAMAAVDNNRALLTRVKRMIERNEKQVNYRRQVLALLCITLIFGMVAGFTPQKRSTTKPGNISKTTLVSQAVNQQVDVVKTDNILFNPVYFLSEPIKAKIGLAPLKSNRVSKNLEVNDLGTLVAEVVDPAVDHAQEFIASNVHFELEKHLKDFKLDSARLNKELQLLAKEKLSNIKWQELSAEVDLYREGLHIKNNQSWNTLVNSAKIEKQVESALSQLKNLQFKLDTKGTRVQVITRQKTRESAKAQSTKDREAIKKEALYYAELAQAHAEEAKALQLRFSNLVLPPSPIIISPAVANCPPAPVRNASRTYSYEYKEVPKVQVLPHSTCDEHVTEEIIEEVELTAPPSTRQKVVKRLRIVRI
ncbi:hypothetical protein EXU57_04310 [Segetibacter sp. 3557_3]|uniref:M56 family metallopeptidase n=1 Tax=Segetibacter sp. 3557_3 TaxID=2547429 RepID=UPI0010589708|nr:M56 family metallopeptidase [Segetibacter sp. 3557_3]TDH29293.1 hypothetical protein EXU57_04310 [Segetibacter sp. 3557_3]